MIFFKTMVTAEKEYLYLCIKSNIDASSPPLQGVTNKVTSMSLLKKNGRIRTKNDEEKNFTVFQVRAGSIGVNQYGRRDAYIVGQFLCIHSSPVSLGFSNNLS